MELDEYNFSDDIKLNDITKEILKKTNDLLGKVQDVDNNNKEFIDILIISKIFNVKKFEESGRNINLL